MNAVHQRTPAVHSAQRRSIPLARWCAWAVCAAALVAGGWLGYGFGGSLGGPLMGMLAAINAAAISTLLASAAVGRWGRASLD